MTLSGERATDRTPTLWGDTYREHQRGIVEQLLDIVPGGFAGTLDVYFEGGQWRYGTGESSGEAKALRAWTTLFQPNTPWLSPWDPEEPPRGSINAFRKSLCESTSESILNALYRPADLAFERRMLVYDGRLFVGWLGVSRAQDHPFSRDELRNLARETPRLRELVLAAGRLRHTAMEEFLPAHAIVDASGRVLHACERGAAILSREVRGLTSTAVRAADAGRSRPFVVGGMSVQPVRLDGQGGVRYLLRFEAARRPRTTAAALLSARQREVAELAAAGATVPEIAEHLEVSRNTVKQHLKAVYQRLEVSSRVELARALGPHH